MRIVIFDDEKIFCENLNKSVIGFFKKNFSEFDYVVSCFTNPLEFEVFLKNNKPEVIFLDISIPSNEDYGLNLAKLIRKFNTTSHIIFVTSQHEKIFESFLGLTRPTDFLIKPIEVNRFESLMKNIMNEALSSESYITVQFGRYDYIINLNEVYCIQKEGRKTVIFLVNRKIEVTNTITSLMTSLPDYFAHIDKGVIVNLRMVSEADYSNRILTLKNNSKLFMSRNSKKDIELAIDNLIGGE